MVTVSSHVLDAVSGTSAAGIIVMLTRIAPDDSRSELFRCETDGEGRISESISIDFDADYRYELAFQTAAYFRDSGALPADDDIIDSVIVRLRMANPKKQRYHIPIMASPHSYSLWWSR